MVFTRGNEQLRLPLTHSWGTETHLEVDSNTVPLFGALCETRDKYRIHTYRFVRTKASVLINLKWGFVSWLTNIRD